MDDDHQTNSSDAVIPTQPGAAERALAEAEERRIVQRRAVPPRVREIDGRQGPEPVRYGDWENKGIACDF